MGQKPNAEGVRKSRWLVVRNTLPQLETTTMKTWTDWFPPGDPSKGGFGKMTGKPPFTHYVKFPMDDGTEVDLEVQFIALDKPEDVRKLLSYECSGIWFNEAREINIEIVHAATARVGRFPGPKDGGCTYPCIIMDTNPPDDSHWWYRLAEEEAPDNWEFFRQPSGMAPNAENLENLRQKEGWENRSLQDRRKDGRQYYLDMLGGKTEEWIRVYVHGEYGFVKTGQPVFGSAWNAALHVAPEPIRVNPLAEIMVGVDSSGRHPAAVFLQRSSRGQLQIVHELCITEDEGMGARRFAALLKQEIRIKFPNNPIYDIWGDPAGTFKQNSDEETYFDILRAAGVKIKASPGMRLPIRLQTVEYYLNQVMDGQPALLVSPTCKMLIRGFNGGYQFRRISSTGEARYDEKPFKNRFADVHDALQYLLCGIGGAREVLGRNRGGKKTVIMDSRWRP
jgi:hypothetical protein